MMGVSAKLVDGVVQLTKLMAHGAMHEACLIEVIRTVEDEAFTLVKKVKKCVERGGVIIDDEDITPPSIDDEVKKYMQDDNATVLVLDNKVRASEDGTSSATEAVKLDKVAEIPFNAVPAKVETAPAKEKVNQDVLIEQTKGNSDVKQKINTEIKPEIAPLVEAPKEEIKEEVKEEMKKLLRRMIGHSSKDDNLKLKLLKELERDHTNNIDAKL